MTPEPISVRSVHTVLGPVDADDLGVVAVHESLLQVLPGAEHAFDLTVDRAEVLEVLSARLAAFREAGGGTVVDATGMFHGRDVRLLEALSRHTSIHVIASTGMGPEELLGGYFLTPQTNPPTPWPAERFAALFADEAVEGMVVPRVERRGSAGLVATATSSTGTTPTDESLLRGAARAALTTGLSVSLRPGRDALADLDLLLDEGLPAERVVVGGLDRTGAQDLAIAVATLGAYVALDHVGSIDEEHLSDADRADLVDKLVADGHTDRILLSAGSVGFSVGEPGNDRPLTSVLNGLVPQLRAAGLPEAAVHQILVVNPAALLTVKESPR